MSQRLEEPIEREGMLVVPVVRKRILMSPRVIGAFVLGDGKVRWEPAFDLTAVALGGQLVGVVALLLLRSILVRTRRPIAQRHHPQPPAAVPPISATPENMTFDSAGTRHDGAQSGG